MKKALMGFLEAFESIKKQAIELLNKFEDLNNKEIQIISLTYRERMIIKQKLSTIKTNIIEELKTLIESYNESISDVNKILNINFTPISIRFMKSNPKASLRKLIIECNKAIGTLRAETAISEEEKKELEDIREEIRKLCEDLDINFEKNLDKAISHAEKGVFLGSVLITSRVIDYILHKIPPHEDKVEINKKIEFLISEGIIEKERKDIKESIIKASKKVRNYFNHRIDTFAEYSDAIGLLCDCISIIKIYKKFKEKASNSI